VALFIFFLNSSAVRLRVSRAVQPTTEMESPGVTRALPASSGAWYPGVPAPAPEPEPDACDTTVALGGVSRSGKAWPPTKTCDELRARCCCTGPGLAVEGLPMWCSNTGGTGSSGWSFDQWSLSVCMPPRDNQSEPVLPRCASPWSFLIDMSTNPAPWPSKLLEAAGSTTSPDFTCKQDSMTTCRKGRRDGSKNKATGSSSVGSVSLGSVPRARVVPLVVGNGLLNAALYSAAFIAMANFWTLME
jgi:hypothetical protein